MTNTSETKEVSTKRVQDKIQQLIEQQQRKLAFLRGHTVTQPIGFTINPNLNFSETLHFLVEATKIFNISLDELVLGKED